MRRGWMREVSEQPMRAMDGNGLFFHGSRSSVTSWHRCWPLLSDRISRCETTMHRERVAQPDVAACARRPADGGGQPPRRNRRRRSAAQDDNRSAEAADRIVGVLWSASTRQPRSRPTGAHASGVSLGSIIARHPDHAAPTLLRARSTPQQCANRASMFESACVQLREVAWHLVECRDYPIGRESHPPPTGSGHPRSPKRGRLRPHG
jgi:hypothetical protein